MNTEHESYIRRCFDLARMALGDTTPNPYVGSVIVKDGKIIAKGYHKKSGTDHAEVDAIKNATEDIKGATLYCNLEPCCHTNKKTPPCTDALIKSGISKVVISNLDPNPEVAGNGVAKLKAHGIEVITGILKEDGELLNEVFFTHITKKRPFIHLKWAQTLDGKIATNTHQSKWITGPSARENSHRERALYDAIMVGANTVNQDDPSLTVRIGGETKARKRIIISPSGKLIPDVKLFNDQYKEETIVVTNSTKNYGVKKLACPVQVSEENSTLDIEALLELLYAQGVCSIYIEGGTKLLNTFISKRLYDRISVYIAPKLLGEGLVPYYGDAPNSIQESHVFEHGVWTHFDKDILFENKRNLCLQV